MYTLTPFTRKFYPSKSRIHAGKKSKHANRKTKILPFKITVLVSLLPLLLLPTVFSSMNKSFQVHTSGSMVYSLPPSSPSSLHVDGKYIRDSYDNIVYLRGCGNGWHGHDPTGYWDGQWQVWDETAIRRNFQAMKNWGINCFRAHTVGDYWLQNYNSYQTRLLQTARIAADYGIYVIYNCFSPVNSNYLYGTGGPGFPSQMPFPPWNSFPEVEPFKSKQDFVNYWASVASVLKNEPNVIFELYNEPNFTYRTAKEVVAERADWFDAMQKCIDAIRATGSTNLIICETGMNTVPGSTWDSAGSISMNWIEHANLQGSNVVYAAHLYRYTYCPVWGTDYATVYSQMQQCQIQYALQTLNVPVMVTEFSPFINWSDESGDLTWATNVMSICNQWGVGYQGFAWDVGTGTTQCLLSTKAPNYSPNQWGQILINAIANGGTQA